MTVEKLKEVSKRPHDDYLIQSREYRISETFSDRDARYAKVDKLLRGEWGYNLPGDEVVAQDPVVMNLGLSFTNDVARLVTEQRPVYKSELTSDTQKAEISGQIREVVAETIWTMGRGDLLIPQQAMDMVVCGAAYTVVWVPEDGMYPQFARLDPRHCYPTIQNGVLKDLLVIQVYPAAVADHMFPGYDIFADSRAKGVGHEVEVWEYYSAGYALQVVAHMDGKSRPNGVVKTISQVEYDIDCPPVAYTQLPTPDGGQRGMLDQLGESLLAKNKIASLMLMYTEHKVFAPWEAKGILNATATPGPNTVYQHDPNTPDGQSFMRRVEPAGSDPQLFALMNLLDLDQRGGIGYPASRQGEVGQSIASAAFVESTQGQLSSIVKSDQMHEADLREQVIYIAGEMDRTHMDWKKPLIKAVGKKKDYTPSTDLADGLKVRVLYGAGAGMSRENADIRVLNLLGARIIDRGTARDNIEFLRDRTDIQDKIEMENAEDSLQQLFWPDPNVPIDVKFQVKKLMTDKGLSLSDAWDQIKSEMEAKEAEAQEAAQAPQEPQLTPVPAEADAAGQQALALEKGAQVQEPADIELPPAPMEQIFISNR